MLCEFCSSPIVSEGAECPQCGAAPRSLGARSQEQSRGMQIPEFWEHVRVPEFGGLSAWGHSDESRDDARRVASEKIDRMRAALMEGRQPDRYAYLSHPIRELRLEVFGDSDSPFAVITRNGYGALVLNTRAVSFVDIDVEPKSGLRQRLFGGGWEAAKLEARQHVEAFVAREGAPSMRIYETTAGLRLLLTDRLREPASEETGRLFRALRTDPLYAKLCVFQRCFRARLTAKPWRLGIANPPLRFPGDEPPPHYVEWCTEYDGRASNFSACRYLGDLGDSPTDPEIQRVREIHDSYAGVQEEFELR